MTNAAVTRENLIPEAQLAKSRVLLPGPTQDIPGSLYLAINGEMVREASFENERIRRAIWCCM